MFQNPSQKLLAVYLTCGDGENRIDELSLLIAQLNPVDSEEHQHGMGANPLVPIHKGMVTDQAKAKLRRF